jgi:hypothetical protein
MTAYGPEGAPGMITPGGLVTVPGTDVAVGMSVAVAEGRAAGVTGVAVDAGGSVGVGAARKGSPQASIGKSSGITSNGFLTFM